MDRRVGVLLLIAALIAVLVVPNIAGKPVPGAAVAEVIAAPPVVGSCVSAITQAPPAPRSRRSGDASGSASRSASASGDASGGASASRSASGSASANISRDRAAAAPNSALPVATFVPCHGVVIGEVISVKAVTAATVTTLDEYDQANPSCRIQIESYLGITSTTFIEGVAWSKSIYVDAVSVGPDAHDRAAGRTWTACVLSAVNQSYPVSASLKSSWAKGTLPDAFGFCWTSGVVQRGAPIACAARHTTQQLGYGLISASTDSATSTASAPSLVQRSAGCRTLAASVMRVIRPGVDRCRSRWSASAPPPRTSSAR